MQQRRSHLRAKERLLRPKGAGDELEEGESSGDISQLRSAAILCIHSFASFCSLPLKFVLDEVAAMVGHLVSVEVYS